jgi:hypothetical protein
LTPSMTIDGMIICPTCPTHHTVSTNLLGLSCVHVKEALCLILPYGRNDIPVGAKFYI